jgi:hypothetical protein
MRYLIAYCTLSLALAIALTSCAHRQLTKGHVAEVAATAAVIAGIVVLAANAQCANCNIGIEPAVAALPPR